MGDFRRPGHAIAIDGGAAVLTRTPGDARRRRRSGSAYSDPFALQRQPDHGRAASETALRRSGTRKLTVRGRRAPAADAAAAARLPRRPLPPAHLALTCPQGLAEGTHRRSSPSPATRGGSLARHARLPRSAPRRSRPSISRALGQVQKPVAGGPCRWPRDWEMTSFRR
ncbi:hypothetical protein ACRAWD_21410 [Caulobacter segnis]